MAKAKKNDADWMDGFEEVPDDPKPRILGLSYGEWGTGKSALWLGAPGPIALFDFDEGAEGVAEDFKKEKDIRIKRYTWSAVNDDAQDEAKEIRDDFFESYAKAIEHARTVIIDKGSQLWEIVRYAEFGEPSGAPRDYYPLNKWMTRLFSMAKASDANFGMIDGMKDKWATKAKEGGGSKGVNTGQRERRGFGEAEEASFVVLYHEKDEDGNFLYTVQKSRGPGAHEVQGVTVAIENDPEEKLKAFRQLAVRIFPDTDESDWV